MKGLFKWSEINTLKIGYCFKINNDSDKLFEGALINNILISKNNKKAIEVVSKQVENKANIVIV